MINQADAVVSSLNTFYSQRFKGNIGYQAATKVKDQGLSGSNSYIMNLWSPNNQTHYKSNSSLNNKSYSQGTVYHIFNPLGLSDRRTVNK